MTDVLWLAKLKPHQQHPSHHLLNDESDRTLEGMSELRVLVADDSVLLREGLIRVLTQAGLSVVGAYGDGEQLLDALPTLAPDLIVLDVRMPPTFRDEGVRAAIRARELLPNVGILLLSQ